MVVFSRIQTLQFDALKVVAVGKFYIIETTKNILGKLTRMCRKSEIPGGLTEGRGMGGLVLTGTLRREKLYT